MDAATVAAVIAALALITNVLTQVLGGTWKLNSRLSEMENRLLATISSEIGKLHASLNKRVEELSHSHAEHEVEDERRFGEVRSDIDSHGDAIRRDVGEAVKAIREHTHQIELKHGEHRVEIEQKLSDTRHFLRGHVDGHVVILNDRIDQVDNRVRDLQIASRQ